MNNQLEFTLSKDSVGKQSARYYSIKRFSWWTINLILQYQKIQLIIKSILQYPKIQLVNIQYPKIQMVKNQLNVTVSKDSVGEQSAHSFKRFSWWTINSILQHPNIQLVNNLILQYPKIQLDEQSTWYYSIQRFSRWTINLILQYPKIHLVNITVSKDSVCE